MGVCVGDLGRAVSPLTPAGKVELHGERVDARAEAGYVPPGCRVVVVRGDAFGLVVRAVADGEVVTVAGLGAEIPRLESEMTGEEIAAAAELARAERQERFREKLADGSVRAAVIGGAVGAGAALLGQWLDGADGFSWETVGGVAATGAAATAGLYAAATAVRPPGSGPGWAGGWPGCGLVAGAAGWVAGLLLGGLPLALAAGGGGMVAGAMLGGLGLWLIGLLGDG
ncbi:MAG: NfeD family protein [Gemmataceae bacterium]